MATKPLDRMMFAQGGDCFFCRKPLARADASVEHLVAVANGGGSQDENCVACCKALNRLFGHMSLKENINILLNQRGEFRCPAAGGLVPPEAPIKVKSIGGPPRTTEERVDLVVADLHKRGKARPATVEKLLNTIRNKLVQVGDAGGHAEAILSELSRRKFVTVSEKKVSYELPPLHA